MKTLVVKYTPRNARSRTQKLLDDFTHNIDCDIQTLDLCHELPDLFMPDRLMSYILRNYVGERVTLHQQELMHEMDKMTRQLLEADAVVLATPMNNFSLPAIVKAWFDSVMQKGKTWDMEMTISGPQYQGLVGSKPALVLVTSGGIYTDQYAAMEHCTSLAKLEFEFMGFSPVHTIHAGGMNFGEETAEASLEQAMTQVRQIASTWCKQPAHT